MSANETPKIPMISITQQEALRWFKHQPEAMLLSTFNEDHTNRKPRVSTINGLVKIKLVVITPEEPDEEDATWTPRVELTALGKKMARSV